MSVRSLEVIRSEPISPARDLAVQRYLLAQAHKRAEGVAPVLHVARLVGDTVSIGRYQRLSSALSSEVGLEILRRPTGGRAARMGDGLLSLSLVLPDPSSLLPPGSGAVGPEKVINRYVRGLLGGLHGLGLKAYYFGRDFLSINRRHGGYLSFEVAPGGETLFHALVALERPVTLRPEWLGYPGIGGNRPDPDPTDVATELGRAIDDEAIVDAIVDAYARHQLVETAPRELAPLERALLAEREGAARPLGPVEEAGEPPWGHSELKPIACGYLEAAVQVVQERFLGGVRIHGDFMSNSGAMERLERELRLVPLDWREIGTVVDRTFNEAANVIVGVRYLRVIPVALLEAAERAGADPRPRPP